MTDEQIYQRFMKEGKINTIPVYDTTKPAMTSQVPSSAPGIEPPPGGQITEAFAEAYLISCAIATPGDAKVAALLIQWLDKKRGLSQIDIERPQPIMEDALLVVE